MVTRMCHQAPTHKPFTYKIIQDQSARHYELLPCEGRRWYAVTDLLLACDCQGPWFYQLDNWSEP